MELWRKANIGGERIVIDALVRRRACEKALFLTPPGEAWVAAPSPILRPLLDTDADGVVPLQAPVEVTAAVQGDQMVILRDGESAPPPAVPEEDEGPAVAAAEAVTARLSTIFQDSFEGSDEQPPAEEALSDTRLALEDPVPFFLRAPEPDEEPEATPSAGQPVDEPEEEGPASQDLFGDPIHEETPADADREEDEEDGFEISPPHGRDRRLIDDSAPYDFVPPTVRPLPERPESGLLTLIALAALGLIFFGGGIFWATNARPSVAATHLMGPQIVGMLAGIAGVAFFAVAVYLLLERLGRAAERQARHRP